MSADEGGKDDEKEKIALRTRLSEVKQRLQSPISSKSDLFDLLLAPLDLLQVVPADLPANLSKYAVWKDCNDLDRRKAQMAHAWISDVQRLLVEKVMVDWKEELQSMPWILQAWFAPVIGDSNRFRPANIGTINIATLSTLSAILSAASMAASMSSQKIPLDLALPPEAVSLVTRVLLLFTSNLSMRNIADSLHTHHAPTKRDLIWTTVVRELSSLPERVANATNGRGPPELERRNFVKTMAIQVEDLLHSTCPVDLIATLLAKLLRTGYLEETTTDQEEPTNIWPTFLRRRIARGRSIHGCQWPYVLRLLPLSSQTSISSSLISFVDVYSLRKGCSSALLNADELTRPGTEGQRFLDAKTWTSVLSVAATIEPLITISSDIKVSDKGDNSDTDEEEVSESLLERILLPSSTGYWSPLMARLLMHILCRHASESSLVRALSRIVEQWSSSARIKNTLWQQEVYLTTLILLLVAQLPSTSTVALCTSSSFISGVSAHLEHLSSNVRRMGMLVAEIVSTASGGKALSFGKSVWDGKGEGKEEARVLRAMYHGWSSREKEIGEQDEDARLSALGLSLQLEVVMQESAAHLRVDRVAPRTRTLPAKRSAPSRKKLLIQSLDDDDSFQDKTFEEDSMPPLTNIQGIRGQSTNVQRTAYTSDGEKSSSSESESSNSEAEGSNVPEVPAEKKEEFGLGMPQKKERKVPIYIHELAPLLREQEREANKLALKHTEPLIKRKTGWGGEVDENAINLALAILSLQNNFAFKLFEEKKKSAMTALVCASPQLVAPCLAEQYFNQQYSMVQRICILNSLAFGARQLSITGKQGVEATLKTLADGFSHMAIIRSRVEGEKRIPQTKPEEKSLLVQSAPKSLDAGKTTIKLSKGSNVFLDLAGPSFIFPLVNRFWAHLGHASVTRSSRYRGSGSTILFDSFLVGAFLDTLAVLCYCAQNAVNFSSDIVPEVINLALTMTNSALARVSQGDQASETQGGGPLAILGASANLFLLLMDAACEVDSARTLLKRHRNLIQQVETWAQAVFESVEAKAGIDRAGRCSAALLVRINEMKMSRQ